MTTVLVFGTFDIIHPGHRWFLKKARSLGDSLIAVVSRDDFVADWKGSPPVSSEIARMEALTESGLVDRAVLADREIRTYGVVRMVKPDIICLGHDQKALKDDLQKWLGHEENGGPVIHVLPPWRRHRYSSSLRNRSLRGAGEEVSPARNGLLIFLMVISMIIYGFSWVSGKRITSVASPATLAWIRFFITFLCFLPTLFTGKLPEVPSGMMRQGWLRTTFAAAMIATYNLLFFLGLHSGLAGKGGLIVTTMNPLITFLILLPAKRARSGAGLIAGIVLGIAGGVLLFEPWRYSIGEILKTGNLAFLGAAAAWSLMTISSRGAQRIMGFRRFNLVLYGLAALMMLPFMLTETGGVIPKGMNMDFWGDMLFISVAVGAFGTGVYFIASSRLGAARGSAFTYLVPVSALVFTSVFLGEKPEPLMIAGGLLAIGAVILINRPNENKRKPG